MSTPKVIYTCKVNGDLYRNKCIYFGLANNEIGCKAHNNFKCEHRGLDKPKKVITSKFLSNSSIVNGLKTGHLIVEDGELEKLCACCNDYWPCTKEFWHLDRGRFKSRCKCCWHETRHIPKNQMSNIKGRPRKELRQ